VLHPDCEIGELDGRQLQNWLTLALPPRARQGRWALVVTQDRAFVGGYRHPDGVISDLGRISTTPSSLEGLREKLAVDVVLVAERSTIATLAETFDSALSFEQDYLDQSLALWPELLRQRHRGMWMAPDLFALAPPLKGAAIRATAQLLWPDATSMVFYVFEGDAVHASAVVTKKDGAIDSIVMHPAVADAVPELTFANDWRRLYKRVLTAVSDRFATPTLGVFVERTALLRVITGPSDQLAKEIAARTLVIDPMPAWLMGVLGGATALAVADKSARTLARFLPKSARFAASAIAGAAQERIRSQPFAALGFDPLELLGKLRQFYRQPEK
jgi:hypothetical protein